MRGRGGGSTKDFKVGEGVRLVGNRSVVGMGKIDKVLNASHGAFPAFYRIKFYDGTIGHAPHDALVKLDENDRNILRAHRIKP